MESLIMPINRLIPSKQGKGKASVTVRALSRGPGQIFPPEEQAEDWLCVWTPAKAGFGGLEHRGESLAYYKCLVWMLCVIP